MISLSSGRLSRTMTLIRLQRISSPAIPAAAGKLRLDYNSPLGSWSCTLCDHPTNKVSSALDTFLEHHSPSSSSSALHYNRLYDSSTVLPSFHEYRCQTQGRPVECPLSSAMFAQKSTLDVLKSMMLPIHSSSQSGNRVSIGV